MPRIDGSRDIKDDSIQSIDIKDGTISFDDMSSSFTWKQPVANAAALPSGNDGDAVITLDDGSIHIKISSGWQGIATGSVYSSTNFNTDFANKTTDDLTEGNTNKYFYTHNHDDRYYTETELNNGQLDDRYYTETESDSRFVNITGDIMTGDLTIQGNLNVSGTTTTVNSETVTIADNIIVLNSNETGTPTQNAGIEVERGTETNYQFLFNETSDTFEIGMVGSLQAVATRQNIPTNNGVAVWDDANKQFITSTNLTLTSTNLYVGGTVSASELIERTPYPKDLEQAYKVLYSMERLPEGEYDPNDREKQLNHNKLDEFVKIDNGRSSAATVSCLVEIIKDLVKRIEDLEK